MSKRHVITDDPATRIWLPAVSVCIFFALWQVIESRWIVSSVALCWHMGYWKAFKSLFIIQNFLCVFFFTVLFMFWSNAIYFQLCLYICVSGFSFANIWKCCLVKSCAVCECLPNFGMQTNGVDSSGCCCYLIWVYRVATEMFKWTSRRSSRRYLVAISIRRVLVGQLGYNGMSRGMWFPTMWHFDKWRLRRTCAVSF